MVDSLIRWLNVHIDLVFKLCRDQKAQSPAAFLIIMLSRLVNLKRQFLFGARFSYIKWSMALSWLDSCTLVLVEFLVSILEQWFSPTPTCVWSEYELASSWPVIKTNSSNIHFLLWNSNGGQTPPPTSVLALCLCGHMYMKKNVTTVTEIKCQNAYKIIWKWDGGGQLINWLAKFASSCHFSIGRS